MRAGNNAGNFMQKLIARPLGTNVASVLRVFINNGAANTTAVEQHVDCGSSPCQPQRSAKWQPSPTVVLPLNFVLPAGYKINCTLGTAVAAGYAVTAIGGQY